MSAFPTIYGYFLKHFKAELDSCNVPTQIQAIPNHLWLIVTIVMFLKCSNTDTGNTHFCAQYHPWKWDRKKLIWVSGQAFSRKWLPLDNSNLLFYLGCNKQHSCNISGGTQQIGNQILTSVHNSSQDGLKWTSCLWHLGIWNSIGRINATLIWGSVQLHRLTFKEDWFILALRFSQWHSFMGCVLRKLKNLK